MRINEFHEGILIIKQGRIENYLRLWEKFTKKGAHGSGPPKGFDKSVST
jgi:hypothetical protein